MEEEITPESVNVTIQQLSLLATEDRTKPVTIILNSPGGSIRDGLVLIDVMRSLPFPVRTVSLGIAASMAGVILAAGAKGHRYISPNSQVMLHQPLLSGGVPAGNCSEVERVAKNLTDRKRQMNRLLSRLTGKNIKQIEKLTAKDTYLNAEEALNTGLVDHITNNKTLYELMTGGLI